MYLTFFSMYHNIEVNNNHSIDYFHQHHATLIACCECWSLLTARKTENPENPYLENLNHLQNLGHFLLTSPCMLPVIVYTTIIDRNKHKGGDSNSSNPKWICWNHQYQENP